MKKIIYSILICFGTVVLSSCEDTSEDISKVTHFASLELKGETAMKMKLNDTYVEPGFIALEGDEDITSKVKIAGAVNSAKSDIYTLTYFVANVDGFSVSKKRNVLVAAPTFASAYYGESELGSRHYVNAPIHIVDNGDGTYGIDDIMGGFQFHGLNAGLEPAYDLHAEAVIKLEADNSISLVSLGSWAPELKLTLGLNSGSYDPVTGVIELNVKYGANNQLSVTLTK